MATKDGRSQIWYADGNGNVEGYTETVDDIIETIIDTYNEHFGTEIQIWTPETITLQVGDTVPNWNAYEKIEMQIPYYAVTTGGVNTFAAGYMDGNVWHVYFYANNNALRINSTGLITGELASADSLIQGFMLPKMRSNGIEVQSYVQEVIDWNVGETIPNVEQYTFITS